MKDSCDSISDYGYIWVICYVEIITTLSISFLLGPRTLNNMSSFARKFGTSHLLPKETFTYPTGQHQHHAQSEFSNSCEQNHNKLSHHNQQQQHHHLQYQKQNYTSEYPKQQNQAQLTRITMETNINSENHATSIPMHIISRVGRNCICERLTKICLFNFKNLVIL